MGPSAGIRAASMGTALSYTGALDRPGALESVDDEWCSLLWKGQAHRLPAHHEQVSLGAGTKQAVATITTTTTQYSRSPLRAKAAQGRDSRGCDSPAATES